MHLYTSLIIVVDRRLELSGIRNLYSTVIETYSFPHRATALSGPGPPHFRGFTATLKNATQSVGGLLWMGEDSNADTPT